ncbi:hypothetical protein DXD12_02445 [Clostridium sp. TF11-13AC]|nr:hypothetical protein DXD12_02445 [Clostridium sp. TF11-13AC]
MRRFLCFSIWFPHRKLSILYIALFFSYFHIFPPIYVRSAAFYLQECLGILAARCASCKA